MQAKDFAQEKYSFYREQNELKPFPLESLLYMSILGHIGSMFPKKDEREQKGFTTSPVESIALLCWVMLGVCWLMWGQCLSIQR